MTFRTGVPPGPVRRISVDRTVPEVYADNMPIGLPKPLLIVLSCALAITASTLPIQAFNQGRITGQFMNTVSVPDNFPIQEVRNTVALALRNRTWRIKAKGDDHIIGYLNHRGREVTLTVLFYSDGWIVNKKGDRKKTDPAEGWVANITRDLNKMPGVTSAIK